MATITWVFGVAMFSAVMATLAYGRSRWLRSTEELHRELQNARRRAEPRTVDLRETDGLPPPVRRYLRAALSDGQPIIETLAAKQTGLLNMSKEGARWKPFTATHQVVTRDRGFVWDARVRVAPGLTGFIWDAYVAGRGILLGKVLGLLTVVRSEGDELAAGELLRFLAEAPWYPTVVLPSQGVRWEPIDGTSARATLDDSGLTASVVFEFGEDGLPKSFVADQRGRLVAGVSVPTPWRGDYRDYQRVQGMRVPMEGEVYWAPLGQSVHPYWRARMTWLSYEPRQ